MYNMSKDSELTRAVLDAFRALETKRAQIEFKGRDVASKVNPKGESYFEFQGYLNARFRVYQKDGKGRSRVMIVIGDLFRKTGEREGRSQFDNPILWGQCKRNVNKGESLYFFDDSGREGTRPRNKPLAAPLPADKMAALAARARAMVSNRRPAQHEVDCYGAG